MSKDIISFQVDENTKGILFGILQIVKSIKKQQEEIIKELRNNQNNLPKNISIQTTNVVASDIADKQV